MYRLPANFDATVFVGRELEQVSFSSNTVNLSFDGEVSITLESSFVVQPNSGAPSEKQSAPIMSSNLMALVGRQVRAARGAADGTLTLEFDEGGMLTCLDDSEQYESYRICIRGKEIIV